MDDIIKLKNMGMSDKDISRFVGCLERGIKLFTINFLSETMFTEHLKYQ
jgi:hypothetical protein